MKYIFIIRERNEQSRKEQALSIFEELQKKYSDAESLMQGEAHAIPYDGPPAFTRLPQGESICVICIQINEETGEFDKVAVLNEHNSTIEDLFKKATAGDVIYERPESKSAPKADATIQAAAVEWPELIESYQALPEKTSEQEKMDGACIELNKLITELEKEVKASAFIRFFTDYNNTKQDKLEALLALRHSAIEGNYINLRDQAVKFQQDSKVTFTSWPLTSRTAKLLTMITENDGDALVQAARAKMSY